MNTTIRYKGRRVSARWYARYVRSDDQRTIVPQCHAIWARFHLPEIRCTRDPAETRMVNLHNQASVCWVCEMSEGYAAVQTLRPTFFPDHPCNPTPCRT